MIREEHLGYGFTGGIVGFIASGYDATIIVGKDYNGLAIEVGTKYALAGGIKIIAVYQSKH